MPPVALIVAALLFAAALFSLAAFVERRRDTLGAHPWRRHAYGLSLAVYCTSWTFYGAVGSAAVDGWNYLAIYVGPILVFLLASGFLERLIAAVQADGATAISDFIGSRFSKSQGVAALVTITAALGVIPYIALQLRSVGTAFSTITHSANSGVAMAATALVLGGFALLFGTRRYDVAGRNEGVVFATALESIIKLCALVAVGALAMTLLFRAPEAVRQEGLSRLGETFSPSHVGIDLVVITLISMAAILCLPRQFYMGVIEARAPGDIRRARWLFIAYLALMSGVILPIAAAGLTLLPASTPADQYVLRLPLETGHPILTMIAFIGGFSAATAMVAVETIALATMVSNDLLAPLLLRNPRLAAKANMGGVLIAIRRVSIMLVIAAALGWGLGVSTDERLASIGHIAFAAMAQIAPLLILAVRGGNRDATAAKAGLSAGLALWLYTLALPPILPPGWLDALHGTPVDPRRLLGIGQASVLVHGVLWSLGANLVVLAVVAARRVRAPAPNRLFGHARVGVVGDMAELTHFVARFVGEARTAELFPNAAAGQRIERSDARRAERALATAVGAPSARALMGSALAGERLSHEDVARMLDESGHSLQFSKGLLAATLENIDPGVSVIDGDQRLIAWNSRYLELFGYPEGMVYVGAPVTELIRFNAERGECGPGEVDAHVARRIQHLRRGVPHSFERTRADGRVLKTVGGPMPGGGYIMCFTDITTEALARAELEHARQELEARVAERTAELTRLNDELEAATRDKTRFLAAASHDLLQPLHAARLFSAALERDLDDARAKTLLGRIDRSIGAADQLLRALLDISKLDAGGIEPSPEVLRLRPLLADVVDSFRPLAEEKGLTIRLGAGDGTVNTDPALLRSIVQNFVSNSVRYTDRGGILVGVRRRGGMLAVEVVDTGIGIPEDKRAVIFREFERLGTNGEAGIGLGLAIVERTARLLSLPVTLRSVERRGSVFGVRLPAVAAVAKPVPAPVAATGDGALLRILVVDDDPAILEATRAVLSIAGHDVVTAGSPDAALRERAEVALVDFHLGDDTDGILLIEILRNRQPGLRAALVTADASPRTLARAAAARIPVLSKPVSGATLLAFLEAPAAAAE
ncbi:MAG: PAS-domain containing protein [Pseudomonadota bacterium]